MQKQLKKQWDLEALRKHIRSLDIPDSSLIEVVNSVQRSLDIYTYHKCLARDAFIDYRVENDPTGLKMFTASMMVGHDAQFEKAKIISEANLISIINITRNTFDIFAQLINTLALNNKYTIKECNIWKVYRSLPDCTLKSEIDRVIHLPWFSYLTGFCNTIKHRYLINQEPSNQVDENGLHLRAGAEVSPFIYEGDPHKGYWVTEVLEGTIEIHNELVGLGITLNEWCLLSD